MVGFVNGLPLVVIELKKPGVPARAAFDENLTHYRAEIPQLFWFNALLIASNGTDSRVGSLTADFKGKRALLSVTTGGPEAVYQKGGWNGDIHAILRPIQRGMLRFTGWDVLAPHMSMRPSALPTPSARVA